MFDVKPCISAKSTSCGAACMVSFLGYYDEEVTLDDMIKECNITVAGSTAKDLLDVGRNHGLDMRAFKMSADDAIKNDRPTIIWWKYGHWCVLCGLDDEGKVVICNPSRGRYGMSKALFASFFSGVALSNGVPEDLPE